MKKYVYTHQDMDLSQNVKWQNGDSQTRSHFDEKLLQAWHEAMKAGIFRYTLDQCITRVVPGKCKFVLQLNPLRAAQRRAPETITCLSTPLDPAKFNFMRVPEQEILFHLSPQQSETESQDPQTSSVDPLPLGHQWPCSLPLMVNVSPLCDGHVLITPDREHLLPQRLTPNAIRIGLELVCLSAYSGFIIGFNSLCALASVNHLHIHAWYCPVPLYVQTAPCHELCAGLYEMDVLTPAFVLPLHDATPAQLTSRVFAITSFLQSQEIAHNMMMCHGDSLRSTEGSSPRVLIWPRRKVIGAKTFEAFNVAVAELAGEIPYYVEDTFHGATEKEIADEIRRHALPEEEYVTLRQQVIQTYKGVTGMS